MGLQFDYFSPFFRAAIITDPKNREGSRWPLWVLSSSESQRLSSHANTKGLAALAFCTDITVKLNLSYVPTITATLSPPFEDARKFLESTLVEWTTSILEVQFGYTNGPDGAVLSPPFEGLILAPAVSFGADATITLNAQGTGGLYAVRTETSEIFGKQKRIDIMTSVLKPFGIEVDASEIDPSSSEGQALKAEIEVAFPANNAAWYYVLRLARESGCWGILLVKEDKKSYLKLTSIEKAFGSKPEFQFRLFDFPNGNLSPKDGVFPILGFSTPTTAVFLSGATKQLRLSSYDSKTREIKTNEVISDAQASPKRSGEGVAGSKDDPGKGDFHPENVATPEARELAQRTFAASQGSMGIRIEVETLGLPNLMPGTLIEVIGVAQDRLDGKYVVFEVTHSIGSGGYSTNFTAYSNVMSGTTRGFGKQVANPNQQKKDETAPSATSNSTVTIQPKVEKGVVNPDLTGVQAVLDRNLVGFSR